MQMSKIRPEQHSIAKKAQKIFESILPEEYSTAIVFTPMPQQDDYGIDGSIQIFKKQKHSGELYHIQLKGEKELRKILNGSISYQLKIESGEFLIEKFKAPIVLVLVDTTNSIVYWHDIQTNLITLDSYKKARLKKNKSFVVYFNPLNTLPRSFPEFYRYFELVEAKLGKKEVINQLTKSTISESLKKLSELRSKGLDIDGYTWKPGLENLNNAALTIRDENGECITYYPKKDISEKDSIKFKFDFQFPKDENGFDKFNELHDVITGKKDSVEIESKYINHSLLATDDKIIHDSELDGKTNLIITPVKKYHKISLVIPDSQIELLLDSEWWVSKSNLVIIESLNISTEPLWLRVEADPLNRSGTLKYGIKREYIKDFITLYKYFDIFFKLKNVIEIYILEGNLKIKIGSWFVKSKTLNEKVNEGILDILEKIIFIQNKIGITFDYNKDTEITKKTCIYIEIVYDLLKTGKAAALLDYRFSLNKEVKIGMKLRVELGSIILFGEKITFGEKGLLIVGEIEKIIDVQKDKNSNFIYKVKIPNAMITPI